MSGAFFLGNIAAAPELYMTQEQAKDITEALQELARLYPVGIGEKTVAWINASFAVGGWIGPAMVAIAKRPKKAGPERIVQINRQAANAPPPSEALPTIPLTMPDKAAVPSQMWPEGGAIDNEDE